MFEISEIKYFLFKIYHKNMYCQNICDFREKKREKGKEKKKFHFHRYLKFHKKYFLYKNLIFLYKYMY